MSATASLNKRCSDDVVIDAYFYCRYAKLCVESQETWKRGGCVRITISQKLAGV